MQETHRRHMSAMQGMYSMDPFMSPMFPPRPALEGGGSRAMQLHPANPRAGPMAMSPFGMMDSMFPNMNSLMGNMHMNMERLANDPNAHSYSSSSVMSYSNTGAGAPQYYQASSSTRQAPGGVRETRKTVRDSGKGMEKMSIGHHIGDRSHVIEKARNSRTGDMEEKQDFVNIDETEAETFDNEWKNRTGAGGRRGEGRSLTGGRSRPTMSAITDGREYRHDREHRPTRHQHHDGADQHQSIRFDRSERSSEDARAIHRRPTPARPTPARPTPTRPSGPSNGGRRRDSEDF